MQESRCRGGVEFRLLPLATLLLAVACATSLPESGDRVVASNSLSNKSTSIVPGASNLGTSQRSETSTEKNSKGLPVSTNAEPGAPRATTPGLEAGARDESSPPNEAVTSSEPSPEGSTVLHVGDSFAGALGLDLNRELKKLGVHGILKYRTATYIPTWAWGKELGKYIAAYHPDLVLITLGANELNIPDPALRIHAIEKLVSTVGGRPCVWIAPPLWQGARPQLLQVIREHAAPCSYMDSTALVPDLPRGKDHIHPTISARAQWAKVAIDWLLHERAPRPGKPWALRSPEEATRLIP